MPVKDTKVRKSLIAKVATAKAVWEKAEHDLSEYDRITAENSPVSGQTSSVTVTLPPGIKFYGGGNPVPLRPFSLTSAVRAIIEGYPPGKCFTKEDIISALRSNHPAAVFVGDAVSVQLWREAQGDRVEISTKGNAHSPTIYKRRGPSPEVVQNFDDDDVPMPLDSPTSQLHKQVGPTRANG